MPFFGTPRASTSPGEEGVPLSPYMGTGATPTNRGASLTGRYCEYCAGVGVRPDPSVLVFLRLSLSELAVRPHQTAKRSERSRFGDTDLFALCDFLLTEQPDAVFETWCSVDLSECRIGTSGALILARLLRLPACKVHTVSLANQRIGVDGANALADAVRANRVLTEVSLSHSFVHNEGIEGFLEMLRDGGEASNLTRLDLSNNYLDFNTVKQLQLVKPRALSLVLTGNLVMDEVLNSVSHGIGTLLVVIGAVFLGLAASRVPATQEIGGVLSPRSTYVASVVIYTVSLFTLYLASTLYHAFFALGEMTVSVFGTFDQCAIYLLIAGSYTPFLMILFPDKPLFSTWLLGALWAMALIGIAMYTTYRGPWKEKFQLGSYIVMGWIAVLVVPDMVTRLGAHWEGIALLVAGGVGYTAGVPFFVKNGRTLNVPDHTIWHVFVMIGSACHYACILKYVVNFPYDT